MLQILLVLMFQIFNGQNVSAKQVTVLKDGRDSWGHLCGDLSNP